MQRRRRINPKEDAKYYIDTKTDKVGLDITYINAFKGRGIFATTSFQKGDFLCEYRGELISKEECERRQRVYHDNLKVFLFEFYFNGKLWCVDAAKEDCSLGRLINDDNISPNAKMKYLTVQQKPHLCLFATRDINQGEEITYNYGDSDWPWRLKNSSGMSSTGQDVEVPSTSQLVSYYGPVSSKDQIKIRAENDQDQMITSVPNETDPVLDSLPIKELEKEMSQSPDCTHSTPTAGNTEQITAENDQDQMTTSVPNETDPVLDSLPINSEELEKEITQSPDCPRTTSSAGNTEQIRAENDQDQMTTSVPNETDPVLDSLPINSEELEEEMSQSPDCPRTTSSAGNTEQITAENDQDQMTTSVPNETDPVLDSLPINSEELEEEMSQSPGCPHTTSTASNTEQVQKLDFIFNLPNILAGFKTSFLPWLLALIAQSFK
ncbi:histone-lysine N-methyltransferase mes-4-like isoform X1 [Xiphophorus hellerii]|uniref:histone-lysine N-methyltransferase mes-4-like isoform X1 n=1 Tax=Xiphophorus hellerii TaxID=8084 RepID=UPI0013B43EE4|nr:histone-lysine N-methyltransferase mes-4-like isoform X1 [Xiphophorus hellerii]